MLIRFPCEVDGGKLMRISLRQRIFVEASKTQTNQTEQRRYAIKCLTVIILVVRHRHRLQPADGFLVDLLLRLRTFVLVISLASHPSRPRVEVVIYIVRRFAVSILVDTLSLPQALAIRIVHAVAVH